MTISRRSFIHGAGGTLGLVASSQVYADAFTSGEAGLENLKKSQMMFQHGVASGDPLPDRVILWTRISGQEGKVDGTWQVARLPTMEDVVVEGTFSTDQSRDYTVKIDPVLPEPGTTYYFRFLVSGIGSMIGRTKTAAMNPQQVRFAVASCSSIWSGFFNAYDRISERNDLDLVIHCGDYIYDYADEDEEVLMPYHPEDAKRPESLEGMRRRYSYYRRNPSLQRAHQQHPFAIIWDNHDLGIQGDKELAVQAFHEWVPCRTMEEQGIIYRQLKFGSLVDLMMLDTRRIGRGQPIPNSSEPSILGETQYQWLTNRLANSDAVWKVLGNQVLMAPLTFFGKPASKSLWDGFPKDRERLLRFVKDQGINGFLAVTGDAHLSIAANLDIDKETVGVEFLPTSVSRGNADEAVKGFIKLFAGSVASSAIKLFNRHLQYTEASSHGYGIVDLSPEAAQIEFWYSPIDDISQEETLGKVMRSSPKNPGWKAFDGQASKGLAREPAPEIRSLIQSDQWGGPHGDHFEYQNELFQSMNIRRLSLRAGARVDQLAIDYDQGAMLRFGGDGGAYREISLSTSESISAVEVHAGKKHGKTRVFYLRIETTFGQVLEGGEPTDRSQRFEAPSGWSIVGFAGRASDELYRLGVIFAPEAAL
ncbi:alkaline phosphatase D family protein [Pseudobacteriovorax antillogorgiicola]|uniref:Alkaline phosphatase D n=1 Tax=Pseudobacteriovorax antillogorgiicola TaxID=1513793 RepID=A0A1Y6BE91_9BACT|nr:alkaline phosphatase D family protein [Pseudobacteriovorax antillogorgiicola]TCS57299.1 alkaline phosphatase D [Pseudobacteriovorax antillogorgiicola]SMF02955.1 alkaline phosphatase D [Pseudobacteriovorax antillogorgiicola]